MNARCLIATVAVLGTSHARAAQGGFVANFAILGEPMDLAISDDGTRAILRTGQILTPAP